MWPSNDRLLYIKMLSMEYFFVQLEAKKLKCFRVVSGKSTVGLWNCEAR